MNFFTFTIMLNLFLLITLQQYDDFYAKPENPIERFNFLISSFKTAWNKYSSEIDEGYRIKENNLTLFLTDFEIDFKSKFDRSRSVGSKIIVL